MDGTSRTDIDGKGQNLISAHRGCVCLNNNTTASKYIIVLSELNHSISKSTNSNHSCPSHTYPSKKLHHHLTSPSTTISLSRSSLITHLPSSLHTFPSPSTTTSISAANPIVIPSSCAISVVDFGPVRVSKPDIRAANDAREYGGVWSTVRPELSVRDAMVGLVNVGR